MRTAVSNFNKFSVSIRSQKRQNHLVYVSQLDKTYRSYLIGSTLVKFPAEQ